MDPHPRPKAYTQSIPLGLLRHDRCQYYVLHYPHNNVELNLHTKRKDLAQMDSRDLHQHKCVQSFQLVFQCPIRLYNAITAP